MKLASKRSYKLPSSLWRGGEGETLLHLFFLFYRPFVFLSFRRSLGHKTEFKRWDLFLPRLQQICNVFYVCVARMLLDGWMMAPNFCFVALWTRGFRSHVNRQKIKGRFRSNAIERLSLRSFSTESFLGERDPRYWQY